MKTIFTSVSLVVGAIVLSIASASATPYTLASVPKDTVGGLGDGQIQTWLKGVIGAYNTANDPDLPGKDDIAAVPDHKTNVGDDLKSINLNVSEYDYLVLHWGGKGGGQVEAFWLGDCADNATYDFLSPTGNGISFYSYYNPDPSIPPSGLPDSGTTLTLLGAACVGLSAFGRRFRLVS